MIRHFQTSWHQVGSWYNKTQGFKGSWYHQKIIIPGVLRLLQLKPGHSVLDLGCGQGVLARQLPKKVVYYGLDLAQSLLGFAQQKTLGPSSHFLKQDITRPFNLTKKDFTHAAIILTLQNTADPKMVLQNASDHLTINGRLVIVLNHPCFRIPRQSSWEIDPRNKMQYRRINRYLDELKIPINMHPGQKRGPITWSFHFPLRKLSEYLCFANFMIEKIEEWTSDKISQGKQAKMENFSRSQFPLFLTLCCRKVKLAQL